MVFRAQAATFSTISGTVTTSKGVGIPGVNLRLSGDNGFVAQVASDGSGRYAFNELERGTYLVTVLAGSCPTATSKKLRLRSSSARANFKLSTIMGYVKDSTGSPLANATLSLSLDGCDAGQTSTNASGLYTFAGLGSGVYGVSGVNGQGISFTTAPQMQTISSRALVKQLDFIANSVPISPAKIAFVSERDGNREVYSMDENGANELNLTNHPGQDDAAMMSPDGSKILFLSYRDGDAELYVVNPDGTGTAKLTDNTAADFYPSWSPDSKKIVFCQDYGVHTINVDGSGLTVLTSPYSSDTGPEWSPDGSRILFNRRIQGRADIFSIKPDGTDLRNLTNTAIAEEYYPAWSPDSSKIAFTTYRAGDSNDKVYVMNADGTGQTRVSDGSSWDLRPRWSWDGSKIAYVSHISPTSNLEIVNVDGSGKTVLTNIFGDLNSGFTWSRDGNSIVFPGRPAGATNDDVYAVSISTKVLTRLTDSPGEDFDPTCGTP
jgi:Tol biopolymer transport system component